MPRDFDNDDDFYPDHLYDYPTDDGDDDDDDERSLDDDDLGERVETDEDEDDIDHLFDDDGSVSDEGFLALAEMDRNGLFA
jgi:hypothetical protein